MSVLFLDNNKYLQILGGREITFSVRLHTENASHRRFD